MVGRGSTLQIGLIPLVRLIPLRIPQPIPPPLRHRLTGALPGGRLVLNSRLWTLTHHPWMRASQAMAALIATLLLSSPAPAKADEVTAESIIDQASALRAASARVPSGARIQGSDCTEIALPGLSFRYRCSVRFTPPAAESPTPNAGVAKP